MKSLIISLLLCLVLYNCNAQKYVFVNYGVDEGLAHSQIRSLHQSHDGALWIGTLGGLSKFDGENFTNYSTSDGLFNNQIGAIAECSDDSLVFGSIGGISFYDGIKFNSFVFPKKFGSVNINQFLVSKDSVLIATEQGLASYKNGVIRFHKDQFKFDSQNIKSLVKHDSGIYILTRAGLYDWNYDGLDCLFDSEKLNETLEIDDMRFSGMTVDAEGRIYVTTLSAGLIEYIDGEMELLTGEDLVTHLLTGIHLDNSNQLLVYGKRGISHLKGKDIIDLSSKNGLENTDVRAVIQDAQGSYWIGTNAGGLFRFTGYAFTYYTTEEGLSDDVVMTIQSKNQNHLSLGAFENGVSEFEEGKWNYLTFPQITNNRVWTSIIDKEGQTWYGTSIGISVVRDGKVVERITDEQGLDYKKVTALFEDSNGIIWAGTSRGLNRIQDGKVLEEIGFIGDRVRSITEGDNGVLYIASRQGVWKKTGEFYDLLPITANLKDPVVYALEKSGDDLWAGTKEGLFLMRNDSVQRVNLSSNFSSNTVNFLELDKAEKLWVGTNYGLFCVNQDLSVDAFSKQDGLVSLETNLNAVSSDEEGLWFGTSYALQRLNFSELSKSQANPAPEVVLTDVKLNLEPTDWTNLKANKYFISGTNIPISPQVNHKNNNFSFSFTTNTLDASANIKYQYMVEGFDEAWQPVTSVPNATYTNLPFKDFTLKVRAKRNNQAWGNALNYSFSILPPFWQTWWFILLSAIIIGYASFSVFQYRRENLITALEKEKFELRSKMLSLEQQSLNSSMNRHFIFNALNSIQYYINRQDRLSANRYLSNFAKLIRKNLDSSQVNFTSLADELERLELYLEIENMRFKDKFDYAINVSDSIDEEVVQIPSMLLQPYLENSIWHGILPQDKQGQISIDIEKNSLGQMEIRIKDNGIGINTSQALKNGKAAHISKGMDITSGRIELLERLTDQKVILLGPLELKDEDQNVLGTQVTIKLPLEYKQGVMQ